MRRKLTWLVLFSAAIVVAALHYAGNAWATPAQGFVGTTLAMGRFAEIDGFNHFIPSNLKKQGHKSNIPLSSQKTKGMSDLYVQSNVWAPGGSTGWHTLGPEPDHRHGGNGDGLRTKRSRMQTYRVHTGDVVCRSWR